LETLSRLARPMGAENRAFNAESCLAKRGGALKC
jgi:hypothetical protein